MVSDTIKLVLICIGLIGGLVAIGITFNPGGNSNPTPAATDAPVQDQDGDGLSDATEERLGTDPMNADTDGDRLIDSWEVRNATPWGTQLPGSDPLKMDLYVQVNYGSQVRPLTEVEKNALEKAWDSFPVTNPDGSEGINLHIDDSSEYAGHIESNLTFRVSSDDELERILDDNTADLERTFYNPNNERGLIPEKRVCVYHLSVFYRVDGNGQFHDSRGSAPGVFSLVTGDTIEGDAFIGTHLESRMTFLTHELLHNVLGEIDEAHQSNHSAKHSRHPGIIAGNFSKIEPRMSKWTAEEIENNGFEQSPACVSSDE